MTTSKLHLAKTLLFSIFYCVGTQVFGQNSLTPKKVQTVINLTRFVDWSQSNSFKQSGKKLYVLVDKHLNTGTEFNTEGLKNFQDWQVVCTDKTSEFENGSVVFVTKSKERCLDEIIRISNKKDILTVSDNNEDFCKRGGMINLWENKDELKFEINYKIIQDKSLDISSKLLALSIIYN